MAAILQVEDIMMSYGSLDVLKNVSLSVEEGETFCIIGPNGAGKTTLFKVMTGEAQCRSGRVMFRGEDLTRTPAHERVKKGMGRTFQVARVFLDLSALDNVIIAVEARRRAGGEALGPWWDHRPASDVRDEALALLSDLGLGALSNSIARYMSHGDKKRLEFALALALKPKILMLDEPTAGMSPSNRVEIIELIQRIRDSQGVSIVMTEHDMNVIFGLAHRLMVLNYGEVIATGTVEEVRANPLVQEVYLGKSYAA